MSTRKTVQRLSAGLVLGAEAVGALVLHESHSLAVTAVVVIIAIVLTVWLLDSGVDWGVRHWSWAARVFGLKLGSKVRFQGWWYSVIRDRRGNLLGGSVFSVRPGMERIELRGIYKDLTATDESRRWTWWSGEGAPFGRDSILYGYKGIEDGNEDEGFGLYVFPGDEFVSGSFYGKHLPRGEHYRITDGKRVPREDVTRQFKKDEQVRKQALSDYLSQGEAPAAAA